MNQRKGIVKVSGSSKNQDFKKKERKKEKRHIWKVVINMIKENEEIRSKKS